jgi:hypothetical protein
MLERMLKEGQSNWRLGIGSAAIAGGLAGYDTGQQMYSTSHGTVGNYARGGLGGAASGAMAGAMIGSVVPGRRYRDRRGGRRPRRLRGWHPRRRLGVARGARQMREARKAIELSMSELHAVVARDAVAQGISQIDADREQRRKAIEDAYSGGGSGSDTVRMRNRLSPR